MNQVVCVVLWTEQCCVLVFSCFSDFTTFLHNLFLERSLAFCPLPCLLSASRSCKLQTQKTNRTKPRCFQRFIQVQHSTSWHCVWSSPVFISSQHCGYFLGLTDGAAPFGAHTAACELYFATTKNKNPSGNQSKCHFDTNRSAVGVIRSSMQNIRCTNEINREPLTFFEDTIIMPLIFNKRKRHTHLKLLLIHL